MPLPPGHVRIASCEDALKASEDFQSFPVKGCPLPRRSAGILAYSSRNVLFSSYTLLSDLSLACLLAPSFLSGCMNVAVVLPVVALCLQCRDGQGNC